MKFSPNSWEKWGMEPSKLAPNYWDFPKLSKRVLTMPLSPSYTLPSSDHGTLHEGVEHAPHEATLTLSPLILAHDGASSSILSGHLPSPPLGADIHETPLSLVDDVFGTPPSCPTLGEPSRMKSLSKSGGGSREPMWLFANTLMIWMWSLSLAC